MKELLRSSIALAILAAAPAGQQEHAAWFQSLEQPHSGISCCSISDCRRVRSFVATDKRGRDYYALIDRATFGPDAPNAWVLVPADRILGRTDNPSPRA